MWRRWIGRWPLPLVADMETVITSDVLAGVQGVAFAVWHLIDDWFIFAALTFGLALVLQVLMVSGIVLAKIRAMWPPVGYAAAFSEPEPLGEIAWSRALRGAVISAAITAAWFLTNSVQSTT